MSFVGTEVPTVILAGRYRLGDILGEGHAGHVFAAHDMLLDRTVAVKVLDGLPDEVAVRRALRAARTAAAIDSPHVVAVLDVDEADPAFVVLEHVDGEPLSTLLAGGPLTEPQTRRIRTAVLAGLVDLHRAGIVHRDVRAQNVLVARDGRALLTSAGLSEAARDQGLGLRIGPEPRRRKVAPSPEQELGLPADPRSDVMATGSLLRTLPGARREGAVNDVLRSATSQDPFERQCDARELAVQYAAAELSAPEPVEPARSQRFAHQAQRRFGAGVRAALTVAGLGALLAGGALLASTQLGTDPATPPVIATQPEPPATVAAVVELGRTRTDLGTQGTALVERLAALAQLQGTERAAEAADLYGVAAIAADAGGPSASYAATAAEVLRPELTLEAVIALADRDLAGLGERGPLVAERLRLLGALQGADLAVAAEAVRQVAVVAEIDGDLAPSFARAAIDVLRQVSASETAGASASAQ